MDRLRRWFGLHVHHWGRWRSVTVVRTRAKTQTESMTSGDGKVRYCFCWQERECVDCGWIQQSREIQGGTSSPEDKKDE